MWASLSSLDSTSSKEALRMVLHIPIPPLAFLRSFEGCTLSLISDIGGLKFNS